MSVTRDILQTWTAPALVFARHLSGGRREDRALAFVMIGCVILLVARGPALSREAAVTGAELDRLVVYALFGAVILLPLILYGLAGLIFVIGRLVWPALTAFDARLSLFWSLLAASPAALLWGLVAGFVGPGPQATLTGAVWAAAMVWFTGAGLRTAGRAAT